jgi:hypothetical protein
VVGDTQQDSPSHRAPFLHAFDTSGRLLVEETWSTPLSDFALDIALDIALDSALANSSAASFPFILAGYTQNAPGSAPPQRDAWTITGQLAYGD